MVLISTNLIYQKFIRVLRFSGVGQNQDVGIHPFTAWSSPSDVPDQTRNLYRLGSSSFRRLQASSEWLSSLLIRPPESLFDANLIHRHSMAAARHFCAVGQRCKLQVIVLQLSVSPFRKFFAHAQYRRPRGTSKVDTLLGD